MNNSSLSVVPHGMADEIMLHIDKIRSSMQPESAILVSTNVNILYTSGRFFRGYVWIPFEGNPVYFVIKPQVYSNSENVIYIRKPEQIPAELSRLNLEVPKSVGLEEDVLSYADTTRLMKVFPGVEFFNSTPAIRNARMVKTPYEIEQMRIDGRKQTKVYGMIASLYRPGMTDLMLQIAIERELRLEGCLGYPRVAGNLMEINMGSVLAGSNADNPSPYEFAMGGAGADPSLPGGANGTVIRKGETVMVDMNGAFNAYQTDMTRIWSLGGLPDIAYKAHECSIEILRTLERETLPGKEISGLYFRAVEIAENAGLKDFFMGYTQKSNFIGHGVGIELNEQPPVAPRCKVLVEEYMTLALEPKFVIPDVGAVGVENTYAVGRDGLECLTPFEENIIPFK